MGGRSNMDSDPGNRSPDANGAEWKLSPLARATLVRILAQFDAEYEFMFALGEYRFAAVWQWERERIRLILHPPTATTASRPYRRRRTP